VFYLLLLISTLSSLLFFLPQPLEKPLKQGLFLFYFFAYIFAYRSRKKTPQYRTKIYQILNQVPNQIFIVTCVTISLFAFGWHYIQLTKAFAETLLFHDADYIGMQEVVRSLLRGDGFYSSYYSSYGNGSYLSHHFAPALILFLPFELLPFGRWGYAIGIYFYFCLGVILWTRLFLQKQSGSDQTKPSSSENNFDIGYLLFVCMLSNIFIYRLATSYHFEILVFPLSAIFFGYYENWKDSQEKKNFYIWMPTLLSLLLLLMVKEDIGIYMLLYFFPALLLSRGKNVILNIISALIAIYLMIAIFIIPTMYGEAESIGWMNELSKEYPNDLKKVTGIGKSFSIFISILVAGGLAGVTDILAFLGLALVYLTHALSTRPWHHEVYAYYSYTIVSFLLYAGLLWRKKRQLIPVWACMIVLTLVMYLNVKDTNYPLSSNTIRSEGNLGVEMNAVLSELELIKKLLQDDFINDPSPNGEMPVIFSQFNLSFFMPKEAKLKPLKVINLKEARESQSYLVIAPKITIDRYLTSETILSFRPYGKSLLFKGNWIEVWKL